MDGAREQSQDGSAEAIEGQDPLDVDAFLALEPWPEALSDRGDPMHWLWRFDLPVPVDRLWPELADTSRLNRSMGLGRMELVEKDGVLHGSGRHGGLRHEWIEPPWEWEVGRRMAVMRRYSRGWGHYVRSIYRFEPRGDHTRLYVYFGWVPRGVLGRVILTLGMPTFQTSYRKALGDIATRLGHGNEVSLGPPPPQLLDETHERIESAARELRERGVSDEVVDALIELVVSGDELDLDRIQPRRVARQSSLDERDVLAGFLHATRTGLCAMSWDVVCPLCKGPRTSAGSLSEIPAEGRCDVCHVEFSTQDDHAVEVTFRVHESIRDVTKVFYCSAEPSTKVHIRAQLAVFPGASRTAEPVLAPGRYRVRTLEDGRSLRYLEVTGGGEGGVTVRASARDDLRVAVGAGLTLVNDTDEPRTFVIEEPGWNDDALLPEHLFGFQEFRDLFSTEYIGSDIRLAVGQQTILFTDIVGSTRFYAEKGDPGAFIAVRDHFKIVYDIVRRHNGAVVKTIGDAVMAVFPAAVDSLRASRAIHQAFDGTGGPIRLRISLNTGPCIAVNWNSNIDYFGGTVNLAAKLQACAEASEVALSTSVRDAPGVAEYLADVDADLETLDFEVKALSQRMTVYRWSV